MHRESMDDGLNYKDFGWTDEEYEYYLQNKKPYFNTKEYNQDTYEDSKKAIGKIKDEDFKIMKNKVYLVHDIMEDRVFVKIPLKITNVETFQTFTNEIHRCEEALRDDYNNDMEIKNNGHIIAQVEFNETTGCNLRGIYYQYRFTDTIAGYSQSLDFPNFNISKEKKEKLITYARRCINKYMAIELEEILPNAVQDNNLTVQKMYKQFEKEDYDAMFKILNSKTIQELKENDYDTYLKAIELESKALAVEGPETYRYVEYKPLFKDLDDMDRKEINGTKLEKAVENTLGNQAVDLKQLVISKRESAATRLQGHRDSNLNVTSKG